MLCSADLRTSSGHQTGQNVWCGLPDHVAGGGVIFLHQVHAGSLVQLGEAWAVGRGSPIHCWWVWPTTVPWAASSAYSLMVSESLYGS